MKSKRAIFLSAMVLWCLSCDMNVLNERLARQEPFSDIVTAQEIKSIYAVNLTWRKDAGADNYIVMRGINDENDSLEFLPIYRGVEQTYIDMDINVAVTYAYRLDKVRGSKIIEGDRHVYYARPLPFEGIITAQSINEGRSVYLAWEVDENADKYIVMKTETGSGGVDFSDEYVTQKIELADTYSYIDNYVVPESSYAYRLDKVCGNRVFKGTEITFLGKTRPDPFPGIITAQKLNNGKSAYLSWQEDAGADACRIMRALDGGSPLVFQDRTGGAGFFMQGPTSAIDSSLEEGKGYFYRLDKQRDNVWIAGLEITFLEKSRPDPFPGIITAQKLNNGKTAYLNWQEDAGADAYRVMRAVDDGNPLVFQDRTGGAGFFMQGLISAIDSSLEDGKGYFYRLDKQRDNVWIAGLEITFLEKSRPDPFPGIITAQRLNNGKSAYLSWQEDAGADACRIMRAVNDGNPLVFQDRTGGAGFFMQGLISAIDSSLEDDKGYFYRLDKQRDNVWITGLEITFLEKSRSDPFPGMIIAQNLNNGKSAYLSWQEDAGADAYRVMRAIDDGKPLVFQDRAGGAGFFMQGPTSAIDSSLEDDKGYFYRLDKQRDSVWIAGLEITAFSRTRPMPFADTPVVTSFRVNGSILINWKYDEGADSYIVMRSFDNPATSSLGPFNAIYEGTAIQFIDTTVVDDGRYVYKLYKRRNGTIYPSSGQLYDRIALGVSVKTQEDTHEPNNIEAQATLLESFLQANIYCYGFSLEDHFLEDIDWYKVSIPAYKTANMVIEYNIVGNSEYLWMIDPVMQTESIAHGVVFQIKNDTAVQKYVTFAIRPDRIKFLLANQTGGTVVSYTLRWVSIVNNS